MFSAYFHSSDSSGLNELFRWKKQVVLVEYIISLAQLNICWTAGMVSDAWSVSISKENEFVNTSLDFNCKRDYSFDIMEYVLAI